MRPGCLFPYADRCGLVGKCQHCTRQIDEFTSITLTDSASGTITVELGTLEMMLKGDQEALRLELQEYGVAYIKIEGKAYQVKVV